MAIEWERGSPCLQSAGVPSVCRGGGLSPLIGYIPRTMQLCVYESMCLCVCVCTRSLYKDVLCQTVSLDERKFSLREVGVNGVLLEAPRNIFHWGEKY